MEPSFIFPPLLIPVPAAGAPVPVPAGAAPAWAYPLVSDIPSNNPAHPNRVINFMEATSHTPPRCPSGRAMRELSGWRKARFI